jgi:hypothetical protein
MTTAGKVGSLGRGRPGLDRTLGVGLSVGLFALQ